jgi:hypothetical protein
MATVYKDQRLRSAIQRAQVEKQPMRFAYIGKASQPGSVLLIDKKLSEKEIATLSGKPVGPEFELMKNLGCFSGKYAPVLRGKCHFEGQVFVFECATQPPPNFLSVLRHTIRDQTSLDGFLIAVRQVPYVADH